MASKKHLVDRSFKYYSTTDLKRTFKRVQKQLDAKKKAEQEEAEKQQEQERLSAQKVAQFKKPG